MSINNRNAIAENKRLRLENKELKEKLATLSDGMTGAMTQLKDMIDKDEKELERIRGGRDERD